MAKIITFEFQLSEKNLVAEKIIRYEIDPLDVDRARVRLTVYFQGADAPLVLKDTYETIKGIGAIITDAVASL